MNIYIIFQLSFLFTDSNTLNLIARFPYAFPLFGLCNLISTMGCTADGHNISDYISHLLSVLWGSLDTENIYQGTKLGSAFSGVIN